MAEIYSTSLRERFWRNVSKTETCWLWTGSCDEKGRGRFCITDPTRPRRKCGRMGRKNAYASRVSWEMAVGPIPPGLLICHHCDNPLCVRPDHLFLGTHADNHADMWRKGRANLTGRLCGSKHLHAKLTEEDVRLIRQRYAAGGVTQRQLGREFGVNDRCVSGIVSRKAWRHVT